MPVARDVLLLFAEGRNAVQEQRWLGHHSQAFTLARYVHLLDGDMGAPLELGAARGVSTSVSTGPVSGVADETQETEKPRISGASDECRRRDSNPRHADYDRGRALHAAGCVPFRRVGWGLTRSDLPSRGQNGDEVPPR